MILNEVCGAIDVLGAILLVYLLVKDRREIPAFWAGVISIMAMSQGFTGLCMLDVLR